jgi:23S rRNA pseudouridine2605 synthase
VIREQLAEFIAPENLPKGDRRPGPAMAAPQPNRRSPKPRAEAEGAEPRTRGSAPRPRTEEQPEKKVYKAGWAKPKPRPRPGPAKPKRRGPPKAR